MKKVYIAIPYKGLEEKSFKVTNGVAHKLMNEGYVVYSPISHNHPIVMQEGLPKGWDYWEKHDTAFIKWCDILFVCKLDGWEESVGVQTEIKIAKKLKKEIKYIEKKELEVLL